MAVTPVAGSGYNREKTGVRRISQKFAIPMEDGQEPFETLDTFTPDDNPFDLPLSEVRTAEKEDDGSWTLTLTWEGIAENSESKDDAELDWSGVDEPIETLPGFWDKGGIAEKYKAKDDDGKFDGWERKIADPTTGKQITNPYYGQTHYLNGNAVLRVTFVERDYKSSYFDRVCKIDEPRVPVGSEALKETVDGMQWLKKKVTVKFRGNVWVYTIEWMMGHWAPHYIPRR